METLTFLFIAFLMACVVTLKKKEQVAIKEKKNLDKIIILKDDTLRIRAKALKKIYGSPYWGNLQKDY
jgi:hypothetical protein